MAVYNEEKSSINEAVADLRSGLSNNTIQYKDKETGQIITTTSSSTRKALEKQLDQAIERQTEINIKVDVLNEKLFNYETEKVEVSTNMNSHFNRAHIGVSILSMSKRIMNKVLSCSDDLNIRTYYQDTYSIHLNYDDVDKTVKRYKENVS